MASKILKKPIFVYALALLCCFLWGSAFPAIKTGYALFDIPSQDWASQILFAGVRFTLAGVLVIIFGSMISKKILLPSKASIGKIGVLAVFQTILQYIFFYIGLANTTGTKGSIINSTGVFFAVIISAIMFKDDRLNAKKLAGCIIGLAGSVIVNLGAGLDTSFSFMGEGFIVICSISYALSTVFIRKFSQAENPVTLSGYQFILGGIVMCVFGALAGGKIQCDSIKGIALLVYLALISSVAYTLWGLLLRHNNVSMVATFGFMTPVFGCVLSALVLREQLGDSVLKLVVSLVLVSVGIVLVNVKRSFCNPSTASGPPPFNKGGSGNF